MTMKRESIKVIAHARRALCAAALLLLATAGAQAQDAPAVGDWRVGAATGSYVPFSSLIKSADTRDTQLEAGPAFSLELQYTATQSVGVFLNGIAAFSNIELGSAIRPGVVGPSSQVVLYTGTAGVLLTADLLGDRVQPTLRLGGGFKSYFFDLTDAEGQFRLTGDVGLGLRGIGLGPIDVSAEIRYLPSSFDQAKLPVRGIATQNQQQNDLVFTVGIGIRP
jgi:hypothetical protein